MRRRTNPDTLHHWLQVSPIPRSFSNPSGRLSFEPDRNISWETPDGGERHAVEGDPTIREHMSDSQFGHQGMLFPPQSIEEYRNTPQRARAIAGITMGVSTPNWGIFDSPLHKSVRSTLKESRMPTELIEALPRPHITDSTRHLKDYDSEFGGSLVAGRYFPKDFRVAIHPGYVDNYDDSPEGFQMVLRHELGHAIDHTVNPTSMDDYGGLSKAVTEGVAVGIDDRYRDTVGPSRSSYNRYKDADWKTTGATLAFKNTRNRVRDTGELRLSEPPNPHMGPHMGQQFYQPTLFDD